MCIENPKQPGRAVPVKCSRTVLVTVSILWFAGALHAADPEYPAVQNVFDKYIEATGGRKALDAVVNQFSQGNIEIVNAGIKGSLKIYRARPNRLFSEIVIDGIGRITSGIDGEVAWENSPTTGPRIKDGRELQDILREAAFDKYLDWRKYYTSAEIVGMDTVDGKTCYRVELTPEGGNPQQLSFEQDSGLLVKLVTTVEAAVGSIPIRSILNDYRPVGDLRMPFRNRIVAMGQERVLILERVETNTVLPSGCFALPEEVRMLIRATGGVGTKAQP